MPDPPPTTPLMEQYEAVKARYPGHLVLFRVGDFFETFGDDARLVARELDVVLTARSADARGVRVPMAGVPHHAVDVYLGRLVEKGYKVALCDQVEEARLAKGLVRREVTRVVTPGTVVEDRILPGPESNFLACLVEGRSTGRYAVVDVTTGEWYRGAVRGRGPEAAAAALAAYAPREVLLSVEGSNTDVDAFARTLRWEFPRVRIEPAPTPAAPSDLPAAVRTRGADGEWEADLRLAGYVRVTQPRLLPYLDLADPSASAHRMLLDAKTLRHLEISRPMNPEDPSGPTLLKMWDATVTAPGRRALALWLKNPLAELRPIERRQDAVQWLVERGAQLVAWRRDLARISDIARISARLASRRVRDSELPALSQSLGAVRAVGERLAGETALPELLRDLAGRLDPLTDLAELLRVSLADPEPADPGEPHRFRPGFAPELDQLHEGERRALAELEALERAEQAASGIRSLKIGYNQVFGYYFEISRPNLAKVPGHLRRKQTLAGGERFTSDALESIEAKLRQLREDLRRVGAETWEALLARVESHVPALYRLARAVGELDAIVSLAWIAQERGHVRPIVDDGTEITVRDGRHPILDRTLSGQFVPNDTELDGDRARLLVLTGPNMSGKSTYMRQIGLIVVLAQAGAFVPAKFARIGRVSGLFTRMGFTDEIGRGKSSFMVEMSEVSEILQGGDDRALVLLDEVGRGTSTFDGLALAWATLQYLHDTIRCRTVLATHYHQLTELIERLPAARNAHLAVRDASGEVIFLHRLVPGSTDRSYGIHVAKLAGLPPKLLAEAERLLKRLEESGPTLSTGGGRRASPSRYTQAVLLADPGSASPSALDAELRALDPDRLTPQAAHEWIVGARRRLPAAPPERDPP